MVWVSICFSKFFIQLDGDILVHDYQFTLEGSSTWFPEANEMFIRLAMGRLLEAFVVGYSVEDQTPIVELFTVDENNMVIFLYFIARKSIDICERNLFQTVRIDRALLDAGLAKAADPSRVRCVPPKPLVSPVPVQPVAAADSVSTTSNQSASGHV